MDGGEFVMQSIDTQNIKLYHIVHVDKLPFILAAGESGELICDSEIKKSEPSGTTIGMTKIKNRRLEKRLLSYPDLCVGECVPFYFCPRSIMLYTFYKGNHPEIEYKGGQEPIIHLVFNMSKVIKWAEQNQRRWVFTDANAGSHYFNDYNSLYSINLLNWDAINANNWKSCAEQKQAEFLVEKSLPWILVEEVTVYSYEYRNKVLGFLNESQHTPPVNIKKNWYY